MKIFKKIKYLFWSVLMMALLLPVRASAAGSIDLNRDVRLTISYQDGKTPLADTTFYLYLVAEVDAYGELTPVDTFRQYPVDIRGKNDDAWRALASTLEGYVLRDQIIPTDSQKTDEKGMLTFPSPQKKLKPGLYLVIGQRHTEGKLIYDAAPFMVLLPGLDEEANDWVYDVTASVKFDSEPVPDTVTRKALKVWKDEGHEKERPKEITVQLLKDGKVYKTAVLNEENNWRITWDQLDGSCKWTVTEKNPTNYTVTVTQEGITFVVTNSYGKPGSTTPGTSTTDKTPSGKLPQTGQLWWPVPVLLSVGLLLLVIGLIRRRGDRNEA